MTETQKESFIGKFMVLKGAVRELWIIFGTKILTILAYSLVNSTLVNVAAARGDIEVIEVPTNELAEKLGSIRAANMVMLGAFIKVSNLVSLQLMLKNLPEILGEGKAKLIKINKEALEAGYNYIKE